MTLNERGSFDMKKFCLFALLLALTLTLCACGVTVSYTYPDAGRYTPGGTKITGNVENLEIDWIDGSVTVAYHKENTVEITETASKTLSDAEKLHWWLDGVTLHIKYAGNDIKLMNNLKKNLTVTLPEGKETPLKTVSVSAVSAAIRCTPLYAESVSLSTVSGSVSAECAASVLKASTISGKIALTASANEISLNTTSGATEAEIGHAETMELSGVSGPIQLNATEIKKAEIQSISGSVTVSMQKTESLRVSTVSGSVRLHLPREMGFTADYSTVSGSLNNDLSAARTGNRCVLGDGRAEIDVSTVSGSLTLAAYQEK